MFAALLVAKSKFKLIVNAAQGYGGVLIVLLIMLWKELAPLEASIDLHGSISQFFGVWHYMNKWII